MTLNFGRRFPTIGKNAPQAGEITVSGSSTPKFSQVFQMLRNPSRLSNQI